MTVRVVLVDDDPDFRLLLRLQLDLEEGIEVVGDAPDGFEGLRLLDLLEPDAVVIDLMMPAMDGFELARRIREHHRDERVVCYTAVPSPSAADHFAALDVQLLRKSGTPDAIAAALRGAPAPEPPESWESPR